MAPGDIARLLVLAGLWGGSFVFIRVAVGELSPLWLALFRVALAFLALFAFAALQRKLPSFRTHWREYLAIGAINSALPFALYAFAEQYVNASTAAILNATSPFFAALVAAAWLKEPLNSRQIAGMCVGFGGVVWLAGGHSEALSGMGAVALLACLAAALCYAIGGVYTKLRMHAVPSTAVALYSQLGAAIVLAPAAVTAPLSAPSTLIIINVLALALMSTAYAYRIYFRLIANVGPTRALTVTFLIPLFGVLWGVVFLHEPLESPMLFGGLLIVAGTWITTRGAGAGRKAGGASPAGSQTSSAAGPSTCVRSSR
jgi:drug/metabolite transporter (DMT)-like permease